MSKFSFPFFRKPSANARTEKARLEEGGFWRRPGYYIHETLYALQRTPKAFALVWQAHPLYAIALVSGLLLQGLQPIAQAWLSKLILDQLTFSLFGPPPDSALANSHSGQIVTPAIALNQTLATNNSPLWLLGLLLLLTALVNLAGQFLATTTQFVQTALGEQLTREVNSRILTKANSFVDLTYFENYHFYDLLERAQGEAAHRPLNMLQSLTLLIRNGLGLGATLSLLLAFQPLLAGLILLLSVPSLVVQFRHQGQSWAIRSGQIPQVRQMQYYSTLLTSQEHAKEIRLFGLENFFLGRYHQLFEEFQGRLGKLRHTQWRWNTGLGMLAGLASLVTYTYLVLLTLNRKLSLGSLTFYINLSAQIQNSLAVIISQSSALYESSLFVEHLFKFLSLPSSMSVLPAGKARLIANPLQKGIIFRDVKFCYPNSTGGEPVSGDQSLILKGLTFSINPGEVVAFVGENGAGKTTMVKLLTRLYDPTSGVIEIDGVNLKECDLAEWRAQIGVVFQDFGRYHLSVRENIGLGQLSALGDLGQIELAAQKAGIAPLISRLPQGLDTFLGRWLSKTSVSKVKAEEETGLELSGGEWQKIALARAFMRTNNTSTDVIRTSETKQVRDEVSSGTHSAQILILDEPTAALDARAEYELYERFRELTRGKITILISHRFSTVKMADKIIVLKDGLVLEQGSHFELLENEGEYARLYQLQAKSYR